MIKKIMMIMKKEKNILTAHSVQLPTGARESVTSHMTPETCPETSS